MSKPLSEAERGQILPWTDELLALARDALELFREGILAAPHLRELILGDTYYHETHYAGLVDPEGRVDFYDGEVRVIEPSGAELCRFAAADYLEHIAERVLPWSYLKFPYLRAKGFAGLADGPQSGVYRVNSLARLNVASAMATPLAEQARVELYETFGAHPVHHTLAFHWARLVELLHLAEAVHRLARDPELTSTDVRVVPEGTPTEGVGVVEAARGTLYHHYQTDRQGMVKKVNLIVATAQNNAAMGLSVKRAAERLIKNGAVDEAILDRVEMAFRAYDPCLACATHTLPGRTPLRVRVIGPGGEVRRVLERG